MGWAHSIGPYKPQQSYLAQNFGHRTIVPGKPIFVGLNSIFSVPLVLKVYLAQMDLPIYRITLCAFSHICFIYTEDSFQKRAK